MADVTASRTLVKSHPELWTECSEVGSLARHLGGFGEIRITRLEPETTVAWEGERASGTVRLEPSAWGTRVVLTATPLALSHGGDPACGPKEPDETRAEPPETVAPARAPASAREPAPEPTEAPVPAPARRGVFSRLFGGWRRQPEPGQTAQAPKPEPAAPARPARAASAPVPPRRTASLAPPRRTPAPVPPRRTAAPAPPRRTAAPAPPGRTASTPPSPPSPPLDPTAALTAALDSLGQAHHRPFSRS